MFKTFPALAMLLMLAASPTVQGQQYSVEVIDEAPDAEKVPADLRELMSDKGFRVKSGSRNKGEFWFCKEWSTDADFKKSMERLYPFAPGQLIGVFHLSRRGSDFREQQISSGWYTLRFALQPVDGNHIGTSPTRDFLVLLDAGQDAADKEWDVEQLNAVSSESAGSAHPAMLCLQSPGDADPDGSLRHNEEHDWWILRVDGKGKPETKTAQDLSLELIVIGHALE